MLGSWVSISLVWWIYPHRLICDANQLAPHNTDVQKFEPWYNPMENADLNTSAGSRFQKMLGWWVSISLVWWIYLSEGEVTTYQTPPPSDRWICHAKLIKIHPLNMSWNLQLDLHWIAESTYSCIFAVAVRFQNQDKIWISHQKFRGRFFQFLRKIKKISSYGQTWCFWRFYQKFDGSLIIAKCKRFCILRAYNQSVPTRFQIFIGNHSFVLVITCTLVSCVPVDLDRHTF